MHYRQIHPKKQHKNNLKIFLKRLDMDTSKLYLYIIILEYMNNKKVVSAGEVLTTSLLNRVSKEAYQFGGFEIDGDFVKKSAFNTEAKTTVIINRSHIK